MIVPLTKYHFAIYHRDYDAFIEDLRAIGEFHVKEIRELPEEVKTQVREVNRLKSILDHYNLRSDQSPSGGKLLPALVTNDWIQSIEDLQQLEKEKASLLADRNNLAGMLGEFSSKRIEELKERGLHLHLFSCKTARFQTEWKNQFGVEIINDSGPKTYFVLINQNQEVPKLQAQIEPIPNQGTHEYDEKLIHNDQVSQKLKEKLSQFWNHHQTDLVHTIAYLQDQVHLKSASLQSDAVGDGSIHLLQAWIPKSKVEEVNLVFEKSAILYQASDPDPDEKNPILLKNHAYGKLFEPVSQLFSLPNYTELDLTPLFAPFFTLFFGFCLGDAGYGLIILIGITVFGSRLGEANQGIIRLAQILGLATIIFGAFTGTLFGIDLGNEGSKLLPENIKMMFLKPDQLFNLSLALGGIQIIFGMLVKMVNQFRQYGFVYTLSTLGWILLVIGLGVVGLKLNGLVGSILSWSGVALVLLFNDPKASFLTRIGKGLWELYGITGVFGDLLSYIRLFALGLSSSILGFVINDIGMGFLDINPILGPVLFIIFMLIGHGLNLFIAGLGAFVHPMRLTFVEFYKNAGFTGGGMKYKAFKKEIT